MAFNKEDKYLVISRKDIELALDEHQKDMLNYLSFMCSGARMLRNKDLLECVVVESTSVNYDKVWGMVEEEYSTEEK